LELRGVVGFPSFHTVQALVLIWYARKLPFLRWIALTLNIAVVIATPIHGGHHLIDVFGGIVVAFAAIAAADWIVGAVSRSRHTARFYKPAAAIGEVPALQ
jgi:membrane-associated phospholipid phosphatase